MHFPQVINPGQHSWSWSTKTGGLSQRAQVPFCFARRTSHSFGVSLYFCTRSRHDLFGTQILQYFCLPLAGVYSIPHNSHSHTKVNVFGEKFARGIVPDVLDFAIRYSFRECGISLGGCTRFPANIAVAGAGGAEVGCPNAPTFGAVPVNICTPSVVR